MKSEFIETENFLTKRALAEKINIETEAVSQELKDCAEALGGITNTWNPVEIYTASAQSREVEHQKFLDAYACGEIYYPQYSYPMAESLNLSGEAVKLNFLLGKVRSFLPVSRLERLARVALYYKIKDDLATIELVCGMTAQNEDQIKAAIHTKYGVPEAAIYDRARQVLDQKISGAEETETKTYSSELTDEEIKYLKGKDFDSAAIKEAFEWALDQYRLLRSDENPDGYIVILDKDASGIDVRDKSSKGRVVFVPQNRTVKGHKLLELMAHEIEGHARQSMNGEKLFRLGGGNLKIDGEILYEGLGKRYEAAMRRKLLGEDTAKALPYCPLAIETAENGGSFYDVFVRQLEYRLRVKLKTPRDEELPQNIDKDTLEKAKSEALGTTYRVMRGHADMSNPKGFAMTKDIAYLAGELLDEELQKSELGYVNESAVIQSGGLQLLAELAFDEDDLPYKFKNVAKKYWLEVIKPQMKS